MLPDTRVCAVCGLDIYKSSYLDSDMNREKNVAPKKKLLYVQQQYVCCTAVPVHTYIHPDNIPCCLLYRHSSYCTYIIVWTSHYLISIPPGTFISYFVCVLTAVLYIQQYRAVLRVYTAVYCCREKSTAGKTLLTEVWCT